MPGDAGHLIVGIDVNQDVEKRNELTGLHTEAALLADENNIDTTGFSL